MSDNKYKTLENKILERIEKGIYPAGKPIPSERALAESENLSRMTVRQAVSDLVQQGVLFRHQGRGTFVSANKFTQNNLMSFTRAISSTGKTPRTKILSFYEYIHDNSVKIDGLLYNSKYFVAKRLRLADETPVALETVYIPFENCPNLKPEMLENSLHDLMKEKYDLEAKTCELSVSATLCDEEDIITLEITKNSPVLNILSKYYNASGKLTYLEKAVYRGDMYEYILYAVKGQVSPSK